MSTTYAQLRKLGDDPVRVGGDSFAGPKDGSGFRNQDLTISMNEVGDHCQVLDDPLLFDASYKPKPAYEGVWQALSGK